MKDKEPKYDYREENEWMTQYHAFSFDEGGSYISEFNTEEVVLFSISSQRDTSDKHEDHPYLKRETDDISYMEDSHWYILTNDIKDSLSLSHYSQLKLASESMKISIPRILRDFQRKSENQKPE